jgi:hypothetical protein
MLGNLNEALRGVGADTKARYVNQSALNLSNKRGIAYNFAWIAFDLACMGKIEAAGEYLQEILPSSNQNSEYQFLIEITQAIVTSRSTMGSHAIKLKLVKQHLAAAKTAYPEFIQDIPFYRAYRQSLEHLFVNTFHLPLLKEWLSEIWQWLCQSLSIKNMSSN